jgi:hypothetical protein
LHCIGADPDLLYRHLEVFVRDSHCLGRVARFVILTFDLSAKASCKARCLLSSDMAGLLLTVQSTPGGSLPEGIGLRQTDARGYR